MANVTAGLLAEAFGGTRRFLSLALHAAARIVLGVVAVEIVPRMTGASDPWLLILMMGFMWWMMMNELPMMPDDDQILWWGVTVLSVIVGWLVALPVDHWVTKRNPQLGRM